MPNWPQKEWGIPKIREEVTRATTKLVLTVETLRDNREALDKAMIAFQDRIMFLMGKSFREQPPDAEKARPGPQLDPERIRRYAKANPGLAQHEVARDLNINQRQVSLAVRNIT